MPNKFYLEIAKREKLGPQINNLICQNECGQLNLWRLHVYRQ